MNTQRSIRAVSALAGTNNTCVWLDADPSKGRCEHDINAEIAADRATREAANHELIARLIYEVAHLQRARSTPAVEPTPRKRARLTRTGVAPVAIDVVDKLKARLDVSPRRDCDHQ